MKKFSIFNNFFQIVCFEGFEKTIEKKKEHD